MGKMTQEEKLEIKKSFHKHMLWTNFATVLLGLWLLSAPQTFGYGNQSIGWSDWISALSLIFFGLISTKFSYRHWIWGSCLTGLWLQMAPLIFWANVPVIYVNDTLIGLIAIGLCISVPRRPHKLEKGPLIPKGWTYNPSSWQQRIPVIFFALVAWLLARYLASYQLGYTDVYWLPSPSTRRVLTSMIAEDFPVSDAGLGALAYSLEAIMAAKGGVRRWHTMPWLVLSFGVLVIPVGLVSILLVMCQPIVVGAWCDVCLLIAFSMLIMLTLTIDEAIAVCQYMRQSVKEGKPFLKTFFQGSDYDQDEVDPRTPALDEPLSKFLPAMVWGVGLPWNLVLTAILSITFLFFNPYLGFSGFATNNADVMAALIGVISIISWAEVTRALRFVIIPLAGWLALGTYLLPGTTFTANLTGIALGIVLMGLSFFKGGRIKESYGNWNRMIF